MEDPDRPGDPPRPQTSPPLPRTSQRQAQTPTDVNRWIQAKDQRFLGAHHVNRLYKQRANLDLTLGEARAWYRTYLANVGSTDREGRTVPIWGVFDVHNDGPSNDQNLWMVLGGVA